MNTDFKTWRIIDKNADVLGIDRSSELINYASELLLQVKKAKADGKITWFERIGLAAKAVGGLDTLNNMAEILEEMKNLTNQESAALSELLQSKFGFENQKLPQIISWLSSLIDFGLKSHALIA